MESAAIHIQSGGEKLLPFTDMARKRRDLLESGAHDFEDKSVLAVYAREQLEARQNSGYDPLEAVPTDVKAAQQFSDCTDFAAELRAEHGVPLCCSAMNTEQALPDCLGTIDGQRVGIEVTRLTITTREVIQQRNNLRSNIESYCSTIERDELARAKTIQDALKAKPFKLAAVLKHISPHDQVLIEPVYPEWSFDYFQNQLRAVICKKEEIAAIRAKEGALDVFAQLFLLIRTCEKNLQQDRVADYMQRIEVPALQHFDAAYLKLSGLAKDGTERRRYPTFRIPC